MNQLSNKYNLGKRTEYFGGNIIELCKITRETLINKNLINQLIRSGTSIGANYSEANNASSKNDFRNKIYICKKESQETKHWLKMLKVSNPELESKIDYLLIEVQELIFIFQKICNSLNK